MTDKRRNDRKRHGARSRTARGSCVAWTAALATGLGLAGAVQADDAPTMPATVTLADALRQALRPDNPVLQQQSDSVAGAEGKLKQATGAFDWHADATAGWQQYYVASTGPNGVLTNHTLSAYSYTADVAREFRNGVEIAPGVTTVPLPQTGGGTETLPQLGLKIPFLRGSGDSVDAPERAAQQALQAARASRAFTQQQMAQQVAATFWRCVADVKLRDEADETRQHEAAYQSMLEKERDKGLVEPTLVQQFTLSHLADKLSVDKAQDEEFSCRRDLGYLLTGNVDQGGPVPAGELPDVAVAGPEIDKLKEQDLVRLALDQRPDLDAAARSLSAAHEGVVGAQTYLRPQLDVHVDTQRAFVTFSRPFGNNYGKGKVEEARALENAAIVTLKQLQDQVRTQVSDSLTALRRARSDWMALDAAETQMVIVVSDAAKRANLGAITRLDYLTAQNQLTVLRQQKTAVRLGFAVNLSLLELAIGGINPDRPTELAQAFAKAPTP